MIFKITRKGLARCVVAGIVLAGVLPAWSQSIQVKLYNYSKWEDRSTMGLPPPGDGDGQGQILVALQSSDGLLVAGPLAITNGTLPLLEGPYSWNVGGLTAGTYTVWAWVDGDANGERDGGEPNGSVAVPVVAGATSKVTLKIRDDTDGDGLPDWWEYHWFASADDPLATAPGADPDGDGLTNLEEYQLSILGGSLPYLNPANWDSDGDGMDDGWECQYFNPDYNEGMNPTAPNATSDYDGDGLSDWQEYCGVDGEPRMKLDQDLDGVLKGKLVKVSSDDLNPIDIDTDFDMLLDSFEVAWYDPANQIDPRVGGTMPTNGIITSTIARQDSDQDGLSNFREQCLLAQLHQSSTNGAMWAWEDQLPFSMVYLTYKGTTSRMCTMNSMGGQALNLGLVMNLAVSTYTNRCLIRAHEWTDPTEGTGYLYVNEKIPPGHDSDEDGLPDGWEVQFSLNPRSAVGDNGANGDPDHDGLTNIREYRGQDGNRSATRPYINGTGDETNPYRYNWRPDTTYSWRWFDEVDPAAGMGNPRAGMGISRNETLGSALPTTSIGFDLGTDSDDDGIVDSNEVRQATSPVDSCDPFIPRAALITSSNGIPIPDPEPVVAAVGDRPAGVRADLQRRDWTIECQVKLLGSNLSGDLFRFATSNSPEHIVYRLSLSNNIPILVSHDTMCNPIMIVAKALPTNRWVHLAGVWDQRNNYLSLYLDGVLAMAPQKMDESFSGDMYPAISNQMALAVSPDGSFVNRLMLDEVRIWGVARSEKQIAEFARKLVPPVNGDDVWVDQGSPLYYSQTDTVLVNGGSLFEGEPGSLLTNVYTRNGFYWIDDGNGYYEQNKDTLLTRGSNVFGLANGDLGVAVSPVRWNDKDGSGDYSRNSLLAYYRFDDGGSSAEDFARRAKNGLLGVTTEEYRFGDRGYALGTNYFAWVTNDAAPVYGVDKRGADDSDHDGLPDPWEVIHGLDPWDDGTWQESSPGAKDGPNGAKGDPDGDGLINLYEYWAGTNPRYAISDSSGILDTQKDRDGDGVLNLTEQLLGSRPDIVDTDDDGVADNEEQGAGTSPVNPVDPAVSRAVLLGGSAEDYLEVPVNLLQRLESWTLECWVNPTNAAAGAGTLIRRVVEDLPGGTQAVNYAMGLESYAGGLRLYAGYVWPDGRQFIVRGGMVPAGGPWTHVAASYNPLNATLILYTNGMVSASTNTFNDGPAVSGKGGETFVRIGEDFAGRLDEVRVWGVVRSDYQIQSNTNRVILSTDTNGLIHYFQFDDGQANTNRFAWSEFHQPFGFQDFVYGEDWNQQWRHAAITHGSATAIYPGAIIPPPSLRVILQPNDVILAGAKWSIDGGTYRDSGVSVSGLTPGSHSVSYQRIDGWTRPATETVVLTNGVATTLTRTYIQQASVVVRFDDVATPEGAAWRVNGGNWMDSGMIVSNVDAGTNVLSYMPVAGWFEPPIESVTMVPGSTLELWREYHVMTSSVSAVILPTNAVADGARWRVDGGAWMNSGEQVGGISLSSHQVEFSSLTRWITPASVTINPTNQVTVVVTGLYSQVTGLAVDIVPADAVATGAMWKISGGSWTNSGALLELPAGTYTIQFKPVGGEWLAPGDVTAKVVDQQVTVVPATYYRATVFGGESSTNIGSFRLPYALAMDSQHRLYVADTYNDRIQLYDPLSQAWTVLGTVGSGAGQFRQPFGVAVDARGNVYVADRGNNRLQMRNATNNLWSVVGSNSAGSALAQFNSPADVVVDSAFNLFVADFGNNRVQRRNAAGVWTNLITIGGTAGHVTLPQSVTVDGSNNVYVSDNGTDSNSLNRVQKFSTNGQFVAMMGNNQAAYGGLLGGAGLAMSSATLYLAEPLGNRIACMSLADSSWTTLVGGTALNGPSDVAWDPRGYLYVADTLNNRVLVLAVTPGVVTNGMAQLSAAVFSGTNTAFTISWFGRLNWNYAVQYADTLVAPVTWSTLAGGTNIMGLDRMTNCTDTTVLGITNRFYRVIGY